MTGIVLTARLRLEPVGPDRVGDLWQLHQDPGISRWYGGVWSRDEAEARAKEMGLGWASAGTDKWLAYDKDSGELVGRGGVAWRPVAGVERFADFQKTLGIAPNVLTARLEQLVNAGVMTRR